MGVASAQTVDQLWKMLEEVEARRGPKELLVNRTLRTRYPASHPHLDVIGHYQILNSVAG